MNETVAFNYQRWIGQIQKQNSTLRVYWEKKLPRNSRGLFLKRGFGGCDGFDGFGGFSRFSGFNVFAGLADLTDSMDSVDLADLTDSTDSDFNPHLDSLGYFKTLDVWLCSKYAPQLAWLLQLPTITNFYYTYLRPAQLACFIINFIITLKIIAFNQYSAFYKMNTCQHAFFKPAFFPVNKLFEAWNSLDVPAEKMTEKELIRFLENPRKYS